MSTLASRTPISALVTNFNRKGLDHDELETLLHEYGHVLHGVLSKTRYVDQSGTSVKRDFVEAPSQMFEEWARREEPLALFAQICPECPRLTSEQIRQLDAARRFGRGVFYGRQWEFARYDMTSATTFGANPWLGSSIRTRPGLPSSAREIATICSSPPDRFSHSRSSR